MIKQRIKRKYYILVSILLVLFFALLLLWTYTSSSKEKIQLLSETFFEKEIYNVLNKTVYETMGTNDFEDILNVFKNKEGEILYVDYNLKNTYKLFHDITTNIKKELNNDFALDKGINYEVPFFVNSNNPFISNLGPKIKIKINYINSILSNFYTKITNYGLNNALVEAYIKITIEGRIVTPVSSKEKKVSYDLIVASKIINGRIPEFYGNYLTSSSSIFDVPINLQV